MSRSVTVPDFGDSGSLCQEVEVAEPGEVTFGPCDRIEPEPDPDEPVPYTLTDQAKAALDAVPEAEPEAWL